MSLRMWGLAALGATFGIAGVSPAAAAPNVTLQRSGNVFHKAVCGLIQVQGIGRCHAHVVTDSRGNIFPGKSATANLLSAPRGYGPQDLRSAYKVSSLGSATVTVAVVDAYGYHNAEADLATYRAQYGLPACSTANGCFRKVDQNGGTYYPRDDTGWSQETALDLDMVSAMCPNCHILLVQASTASYGALATAENTAARLGAHAISNSYGGGEYGSGYYEGAYNHPGVAITVSSGDSGYGVEFPASSPHVTAVGGTSLSRVTIGGTRGWTEKVWVGAGSGCSNYYAKPLWQTDGLCKRTSRRSPIPIRASRFLARPVTAAPAGWCSAGPASPRR